MLVMSELEILSIRNLRTLKNFDVISICDDYDLGILDRYAKRVLHLQFLDDSKDFKDFQAKQIKEFVKDHETTIVHCKMGQSRSVAVAAFYNNKRYMNMNKHVYTVLSKLKQS